MKPLKELLNFSIINIDKASGPTSFSFSDYVKKQLGLSKTSHFGTLDPKVTGVLPVALGRACKLTGFFLGHDKEYIGVMHVNNDISLEKLKEIIDKNFVGKIMQLPPIKSRVKREIREREVKKFELLEKEGKDFLFIAEVQGGTYIRKLCSDLGNFDDVGGAHMLELRRVRAGVFKEDTIINLYDFKEAVDLWKKGDEEKLRGMLVPGEKAIKKIMPVVQVKKGAVKKLLTGKPLFKKDVSSGWENVKDVFAVFCGDDFIEIAKKSKERDIVGRGMFVFN